MKILPRKKFLPIATAVFGEEEKKEILDTIDSGWITLGPKTKIFEENLAAYTGAKYAIALNSCSAALHLSMVAAGINPGDEVITTPFTFAATALAIMHCGARPIFVDIDVKTFNIDHQKIESAITKKTKAILPVHYGGQPVELDTIKKIADKYKLLVIEDAAHAIGARYKGQNIGVIGDMTCFSFHPVKNMTTGDGGAITTNDASFAERLMVLRVNGMEKESWKRNTTEGSWDYGIIDQGYKYHMNDLSASLGIHQLKKIEKFREIREKIADIYDEEFKEIEEIITPFRMDDIKHAHNLYPILFYSSKLKITRNQLMEELKKYNIGTVVYFRPLHTQPYFMENLNLREGDFPVAEYVFERLICLPIYAGMQIEDAVYVATVIRKIIKENNNLGKI
jgi:dTDP-4-amino-4,6-dideoxygalactose transaminase